MRNYEPLYFTDIHIKMLQNKFLILDPKGYQSNEGVIQVTTFSLNEENFVRKIYFFISNSALTHKKLLH